MILQSLTKYYDALAEKGKIVPDGWSPVKVSLALKLDENGYLKRLISMRQLSKDGKKEVPVEKWLPEQAKRSSNVKANFLCDNAQYIFGWDIKSTAYGNATQSRARECFEDSKRLHCHILKDVNSELADRIVRFFKNWNPDKCEEHEELIKNKDILFKGGNIVFCTSGSDGLDYFAHEGASIKAAWQKYSSNLGDEELEGICLVTGEKTPISILHPSIKNVVGAQTSGASLVSYNTPSSNSFGHEQGMNASVGKTAAFKYGAALNYLTSANVANIRHKVQLSDTTVVFWAGNANEAEERGIASYLNCDDWLSDNEIRSILRNVARGEKGIIGEDELDPNDEFCILGIAPNASRLSVRFFSQGSFGSLLKNLEYHYERLEILKPKFIENPNISIWHLLNETIRPTSSKAQSDKSKDSDKSSGSKGNSPSPGMASALTMAILNNSRYPESLYQMVMNRLQAERNINWRKAAIIKAYFLKNGNPNTKEVATVELNEKTECIPYVLGRMFAVFERIQRDSGGDFSKSSKMGDEEKSVSKAKSTIKDKYFTSASATPAYIYPLLHQLSHHHLRKIRSVNEGKAIFYEKLLVELNGKIKENIPNNLNLQEQGAFYLGYYHETQKLFGGKKEEE